LGGTDSSARPTGLLRMTEESPGDADCHGWQSQPRNDNLKSNVIPRAEGSWESVIPTEENGLPGRSYRPGNDRRILGVSLHSG